MAEYTNPGYAAAHALEQFVLDRDEKKRQEMLDNLHMQTQQLQLEQTRANIARQQRQDELKDYEDRVSGLVPGDVPDADLIAEGQRLNRPLPVKIQKGTEVLPGPTEDGQPLTQDSRIYLGSPQYRLAQKQKEDTLAAQKQRGSDLSNAFSAPDDQEFARAALEAGATPAELNTLLNARQTGQPVYRTSADKKTILEFKDGQWQPVTGPIKEKAHWIADPQPVHVNVGQGGMDSLNDAALTFMADRVLAGGDEPAFGSGTQGAIARQKFATKLAEVAAARGITGDELAKIRMRYKADSQAAGQLAKTFETTEAFSDTARENLKLLNDVLEKIPDSDYSAVNWFNRNLGRVTGNTNIAAFDTYRRSVANEFARIISQANGGVLTDSARKETDQLLNPNASKAQIHASITALESEAANRTTQYGKRLETLAPGAATATSSGFKVKSVKPAGK